MLSKDCLLACNNVMKYEETSQTERIFQTQTDNVLFSLTRLYSVIILF